jgi:formate dehydrogenase major subunit
VIHVNVTRRTFIRTAGGAVVASTLGFDVRSAYAQAQELKISKTTETRSTCPYCAVACGVIIHTLGDKAKNVTAQVVHVEGDPDCPTNRGTLCPKGSSLYHDILNDRRLLRPEVRRPGSGRWEPIPWDQAFEEIGRHIKSARDESFVATDARGRTVNRCENLAWIGGCTDTNEFNYLVVKTMRSMGLAFIENQARV